MLTYSNVFKDRIPLFSDALGCVSNICRYFKAEAVMWAVGATAVVSFGMSLFAMQSKVRSFTCFELPFATQPKVKFHKLQRFSSVW